MARRPEPIEKREGKGNPGKRPMPKDYPSRVEGEPVPPDHLNDDGLECWERVSVLLRQRGQLSMDSAMSLAALCECYAEWVELSRDLRKNGRFQVVDTAQGVPFERVRPALKAFQEADKRLKGWLIEFGLTDASRAKVTTSTPKNPDDPLAEFGLH